MFARCGKILVVLALVAITGAHWAALRTVAWTAMLANNLRTESLTEAVARTFDGNHPCCLCKAIAAAKKSEKKDAAVAPVMRMEFPPLTAGILLLPPSQFELLPRLDCFAEPLSHKPPLPPPRGFSA